jgi:hypothetical protein
MLSKDLAQLYEVQTSSSLSRSNLSQDAEAFKLFINGYKGKMKKKTKRAGGRTGRVFRDGATERDYHSPRGPFASSLIAE